MKNRWIVILTIILICSGFVEAGADTEIMMSISHRGTINSTAFNADGTYVFTAGEDGTVRIWDRRTTKLLQTLRVSYLPLLKIAVNPRQRQFAVLEEGTLNDYTITVWNWENGKKLFSYKIDEIPMQISYSPGGSFLVFSRTAWDSLTFLDSQSGRPLPYLKRGFGIVSDFIVSGSEQTIMTYHPSGSIQYWEIRSGKKKQSMPTLSELKGISFSGNRRYMAGYSGEKLNIVDLVTGKMAAQIDSEPLSWTAFDSSSRRVYALSGGQENGELTVYTFRGTYLERVRSIPLQGIVSSAGYASALYISFANSGIPKTINVNTRLVNNFLAAELTDIDDAAFLDGKAVFTSGDTIYICTSDFFSTGSSGEKPEVFQVQTLENPFRSAAGVTPFRDNSFLLWKKGGGQEGIFQLLDAGNLSLGEPVKLPSPILSMEVQGNTALILETSGRCSLLNLETMETAFTFSSFGIQDVCFAGYSRIVAGKSKTSGFDSSLVEINVVTGETVLIDDSNLFTYDLLYDARSKQIYSLGMQNIDGALRSVFKVHTGTHFEYSRILSTFDEEDSTASLAIDPESYRVYTSLGYDLIKQYKGYGIVFFEKTPRIPRKLKLYGKLLYSINRDRSISVWDSSTGLKVTDFYMLGERDWIALFGEETYTGTGKAQEYLSISRGLIAQ